MRRGPRAGDGDRAAVVADDAVHHRKAQAGADARPLVVKKGSKIDRRSTARLPLPLSTTTRRA